MKLSLYQVIYLTLIVPAIVLYGSDDSAKNDSLPLYWMNEVVVVGERLPMMQSTSIYEIKRMVIRNRDVHDVSQALRFVPGMHVYLMSKNEMALNLRGFEQRQISLFLDGVPISLPYDGQIDLSQLIGDQLELIRIARGSTSPLYGVNTLGGGINLISGSYDESTVLNVRMEGSTHSQIFTSVAYHNQLDRLRYRFYGNYFKGDGFVLPNRFDTTIHEDGSRRNNSDFEKFSAGIKVGYDFTDRHTVSVNANWIDNAYGIPPNTKTATARYWRFPEWKKNVYSLSTRHLFSDKFIIRSVIFYDSYYNLLKSYDDANYKTQLERYAWDSIYDDYSFGFFLYPSLRIFSLGSSNIIVSYKKDVHQEKFRDADFNSYKMATLTLGFEQDLRVSTNHSLIIGADINRLDPLQAGGEALRESLWMLNGQAAYQFELTANMKIHISLAKKGRYPTLKELYSERLGRTVPNPDLKSEHAINTELGIMHKTEMGYFQAIIYYNTLKNLIVTRQLGQGNQQLQNIGNAILQGLELDAQVNLVPLGVLANYTLLSARNVSPDRPNDHLPNRPYHVFNLIINWEIVRDFNIFLENKYVLDQYYENPNTLRWEKFADYYLINSKLTYQIFKYAQCFVRINNMTDVLYENDFGIPAPGREILFGIKFSL